VIDSFPARDLALGGAGGPLDTLPLWLFLHDARRARLVVDLQSTSKLTYLPASCEASGAARVAAFNFGPGPALIVALRESWPQSTESSISREDTELPEASLGSSPSSDWLIAAWEAHPSPWLPTLQTTHKLADSYGKFARGHGSTLSEAIRGIQFAVAEFIVRSVAERVPRRPPLGQFVFAQNNQEWLALRPYLADRLSDVSQIEVAQLGWEPKWLSAGCAAAMAMLHIEQIPSGGTLLTGSSAARVLGTLTPGTPANWRRLLHRLAENQPATMSLRSAI